MAAPRTAVPSDAVRTRRSRLSFAAIVVAAVAAGVSLAGPVGEIWEREAPYADFTQDYASARAWSDGEDPYAQTPELVRRYAPAVHELPDPHLNPHPPVQIVLTRPLGWLPYRTARTLWLVLMAVLIVGSVALVARALGWSGPVAVAAGLGMVALPTSRLDLGDGQINGVVLLMLVSAWLALRRGNDAGAGVALGVATAIKLFPIFLAIPLLRMGRRRALGWQIGVAAVLSLAGILAIGASAGERWLSDAVPENARYWRSVGHNISLVSVPYRWLTGSHWRPEALDLPLLAGVLAALLGLACVAAAFVTPARASGDRFWAAVPWMILAAPLAWADYLVLVFPLLLLIATGTHGARSPPLLIASMVAVVIGRPVFVYFVHPVSPARQLLLLSIPMWGLLGLGISDAIGRRGDRLAAVAADPRLSSEPR